MDYEEKYKTALERAKGIINYYKSRNRNEAAIEDLQEIFPELKESEDEKIRETLIKFHKSTIDIDGIKGEDILAWLEKQVQVKESTEIQHDNKICKENDDSLTSGDEKIRKMLIKFFGNGAERNSSTNGISDKDILDWLEKQKPVNENEFAKGVLIRIAMSIMQWLDANLAEGNMCLSNMECEDLENAVRNDDWQKVYGYMKKKLEKQGIKPQGKSALEAIHEQNPDNANKVERNLKIEEGKYYVCIRNLDDRYGTRAFRKGIVYYSPKNGSLEPDNSNVPFVLSCAEHYFRPWTVEDAKEGDVLYSPNLKLLWIFKSRDTVYCGCNLNYNDGAICGEGYFERPTDAIPATKEQRELFFQKMKEAGCRRNSTEKKLEKIDSGKESESKKEERTYNTEKCNCIIQDTISICEQARKNATNEIDYENTTRCIGWLKILKYRHTWKPSKEQMDTLLFISSVLKDKQVIVNLEELKTLYNDLKKL